MGALLFCIAFFFNLLQYCKVRTKPSLIKSYLSEVHKETNSSTWPWSSITCLIDLEYFYTFRLISGCYLKLYHKYDIVPAVKWGIYATRMVRILFICFVLSTFQGFGIKIGIVFSLTMQKDFYLCVTAFFKRKARFFL